MPPSDAATTSTMASMHPAITATLHATPWRTLTDMTCIMFGPGMAESTNAVAANKNHV
ncbi:hypothetical protein SXCC_01492 [Gluconacetobacter sp. SXCC-1]|nr:hypothetical protein SXCC_01492 [Gluconacetobacter sp. SXCC-1]